MQQLQLDQCDAYISGVAEAAGMIDVDFPKRLVDTTQIGKFDVQPDIRKVVVDYIDSLPNSRMSDPAARSVYDALATTYPYAGAHKSQIPYRPKQAHSLEAGG